MRSRLLAAFTVLVLFGCPAPSGAQVEVTDVIHIAVSKKNEIIRYAQAAYQIYQKAVSIYNEYKMIENQVTALKKLQVHHWRDIGPLYWQLNDILHQAESLTYTMEDLEERFYETFPGSERYTSFVTQNFTEVQRALDVMRLNLRSLNQVHQDQRGSLQVLGELQLQADRAEGHEQALEVLTELGSWQASQLATMGATLQSIANAQIVAASYQINQEARMRQTTADALAATVKRAEENQARPATTYTVVPFWMPRQ
jgi:P-type conjugative transfer protein TrbJ